jgi:nucleotide-binding universal stress UspA family protein
MYDRILLPFDGSAPATAAARHALELAGTYDAELHAVFVVDTDTGWLTVSKSEVREALRELGDDESERVLSEVERLAAEAGVGLSTTVLEGHPAEAIVDHAADSDADLVVMGTHGRSGIGRRLLGSVTERVVRGADVPVMTVGPDEE